ncbi:MAG TPA: DUF3891 family protein [Chloroflexota bacterium]|nr:DUF3891 family protein [Chloroflexota bacterium]
MIIRRVDGELVIARQTDHMAQVARMAERWGNTRFPAPEHREETIRAAGLHDCGWRLWEDAPTLFPETGRPRNFTEIERPIHAAFYRAGVESAVGVDPYTGLLASLHASVLCAGVEGWDLELLTPPENPDRTAIEREFIEQQTSLQGRLRSMLALEARYAASMAPDRLWPAYLRLRAWDRLSLYFLSRGLGEGEIDHIPENDGETTLVLRQTGQRSAIATPWPFGLPEVTFPVVVARVPDRRYEDGMEFLSTLVHAQHEVWDYSLAQG